MTVNFEIKSQLAKLLATEDLVVENKDVETAEFNVHTRVLTLPFWKRASSTVYDMLVGHEVGHALFTPDEDWTEKVKVPQQIVNVCEDARIEKLIKRKYAGLAKTFFNAYKELNDEDFFELEDQNIDDLNLADRANLYFKGSSHISVDFSVEEKEIVDLIGAAETFDETLKASEVLYKYCVDQQQKEEDEGEEVNIQQELDTDMEGGDRPDLGKDDTEYSEEKDEGEGKSESKIERVPEAQQSQPQRPTSRGEIEVLTDEILQEKLSELNDPSTRGSESAYASVPKVDLDNIIIPHTQVRDELNEHFNSLLEATEEREWTANYSKVDGEYRSFKNSAKKEVSYLVKEFECKKSADAYARSSTARTGVLDTTKLHTYKFNEDIFKRINVVPDGKNHGLIFILDWSGSMTNCLLSTLKQLYNLIWFCQKVQIPFEVYAFSNTYRYNQNIGYYGGDPVVKLQEEKEYDLVVDNNFVLLNFFSSKFNKAGLENQMANVWRLASNLDATNRNSYYSEGYVTPNAYNLGGTPLNDTLVCLHQILPQFKKENKLQKVQCVILTDGEGAQMPIYKEYKDYRDDDYHLGTRHLQPETSYLRNRKTGYTYKVPYSYYGFTDVLLKDLKQVFSDVNFIGIRIVANRDFGHFIRKYEYLSDEKYKKARKEKTYSIKDSGYDSYFAIIDSALSNDDEFEVQEDASKAQIKRAFVKSLKAKKLNKKVLGEFVELVA